MEREDLPVPGFRLLPFTLGGERIREIEASAGITGIEPERLLEAPGRIGEASLAFERRSEVVERKRLIRVDAQRVLKMGNRVRIVFAAQQERAETEVRRRVRRIVLETAAHERFFERVPF